MRRCNAKDLLFLYKPHFLKSHFQVRFRKMWFFNDCHWFCNGKFFLIIYSSLGMARSRYHSRQKMSSLQISCLSKMKWTLKFRNVYIFKETWVLRVKWVGLQKCIRARECYFRWLAKEWFIGANEASSLMRVYQSN